MEVEVLEVLELGARGREELLHLPDVRVHGATDVEEEQHLHLVLAGADHLQVEVARVVGGGANRSREVQLLLGALADELAEASEGDLQVARAELDLIVEVAELALVPHLHGARWRDSFWPIRIAHRVVAVRTEGRRAEGADPLAAARVALVLLREALAKLLEELLPAAARQGLLHLLRGEVPLCQLPQPLLGDVGEVEVEVPPGPRRTA